MKRTDFKQNDPIRLALAMLFIITELILSFVIQLVPFRLFGVFAYLSVFLAFCFSFMPPLKHFCNGWFIRLGLLFTLLADFFLVVLRPERQMAGVSVFIFTQLAYGLYLYLECKNKKQKYISLIIRAVLSIVALALPFAVLGSRADILSVISVFYYAQLLANLIIAACISKKAVFAIALLLFALCDLSIGLNSLAYNYIGAAQGSFLYAITHTNVNLAWVFYLPSQVLISLCVVFNKKQGLR